MKDTRSKLIFLTTCTLIGVIVLLAFYFVLVSTGIVKSRQTKLIISAIDCEKEYDGTKLECSEYEITYGKLIKGHEIEVFFSGSQTEVGVGTSEISAKITDSQGADVTGDYSIEYLKGEIKVNPRSLTVSSGSREKYYDNTPLFADPDDFEIVQGSLLRGHEISAVAVSEITKVGEIENVITAFISDNDGIDVTSNYDITYTYGKLSVLPNELSVKALSQTFIFDGQAHSESGYVLESGSDRLSELGHKIEVTIEDEITFVGEVPNTPKVVVFDADGNDVTHLWSITAKEGTLSVIPKRINVYTNSLEKQYDGTPLTAPIDSFIQPVGLVLDHTLNATCVGTQTKVGESANSITETIITNGEGEDVTDNYSLSFVYGLVKVNPRRIVVNTASGNWAYDGLEHTKNTDSDWGYSGSLLDGDEIEIEITGAITEIGTARNACFAKVLNGETDVSGNYEIIYEYGELKVFQNKYTIYVKTPSYTVEYDGNEHKTDSSLVEIVDDSQLQDGHYIDETVWFNTITQVNAGKYENKVLPAVEGGYLIRDAYGNDVSSDYDIGYLNQSTDLGTLVIEPRVLIIETPSATKAYDGTPLITANSWNIIDDSKLLLNHSLSVIGVIGSQTSAGTSKNKVSFVVTDGENIVVSENYTLNYSYLGDLTVTPIDLYLTIIDTRVNYDIGDTTAQLKSEASGLVNGDTLINAQYYVDLSLGVSMGCEVSEVYSVKVFNSKGEDVSSSYRPILTAEKTVIFIPN